MRMLCEETQTGIQGVMSPRRTALFLRHLAVWSEFGQQRRAERESRCKLSLLPLAAQDKNQMSTLLCIHAHGVTIVFAAVVDAGDDRQTFLVGPLNVSGAPVRPSPWSRCAAVVSRHRRDVGQRNACGAALWGVIGLASGPLVIR